MKEKGKMRRESPQRISATKTKGVVALIGLLFVFQLVTFIIHKCSGGAAYQETSQSEHYGQADSSHSGSKFYSSRADKAHYSASAKKNSVLFSFNPNTISQDSLQLLGLSAKQALTIIHYREKGGVFRHKSDFAKMYVVSEEFYNRVEPFIEIPEESCRQATATSERADSLQTYTVQSNSRTKHSQSEHSRTEYSRTAASVPSSSNASLNVKSAASSSNAPDNRLVYIDINEADSAALVTVRGIGPYFASQILRLRGRLGSFADLDQLLMIRGMNEERLQPLKKQLFIHPAGIIKFNIATAPKEFLRNNPYIGAYTLRGIELYLKHKQDTTLTLEELVSNNLLSPESAQALSPYMKN